MIISRELFTDSLNCQYKAYLRGTAASGTISEYEKVCATTRQEYRSWAQQRLLASFPADHVSDSTRFDTRALQRGFRVLTNVDASVGNQSVRIDAVVRSTGYSSPPFEYFPVLFSPTERTFKQDKLVLAFCGVALARMHSRPPRFGKIIYGGNFVEKRIRIDTLTPVIEGYLNDIVTHSNGNTPPHFRLNDHCRVCEFQEHCQQLAREKDDLSLLRGLRDKEITQLNQRGIFTTTQLSYTFRPRRRRKRPNNRPSKHHQSLQALAIRTDKVYIVEKPQLPTTPTRVYVDIEGAPDRNFYYLIGVHISCGGIQEQFSLWADSEDDERAIWNSFLRILARKREIAVFHYGAYDADAFTNLQKKYGADKETIKKLFSSRINVLSLIFGHIYFPTFSNDLKSIAMCLGFKWSDEQASGLQSLVWRHRWERGQDCCRDRLITYNREDCAALRTVTQALFAISQSEQVLGAGTPKDTIYTQQLARGWPNIYRRNEFYFPALDRINRCAYFDYQRERVFVRTSRSVRAAVRHKRRNPRSRVKVNREAECPRPRECPRCFCSKVSRHGAISKTVHDLRIFDGGVRRWNIKHLAQRYICSGCGKTFFPEGYPSSRYGATLRAWTVYQNVAHLRSHQNIVEEMREIFGDEYEAKIANRFKSSAATYYEPTYRELLERIRGSDLVHVDETKVSVKGKTGYVWVFTNLQEVAYVYSATREGDTLRKILEGFSGVLVSDFYAAYDSVDCEHQRCLIHLIRDINDDLFKHPFDEDLKRLGGDFTNLLVPIVETIDRYGLKRRHLNKHRPPVRKFLERISRQQFASEVARGYQQRFSRNQDKLFTFLSHDGIPWNNNNAENAVKRFAFMRRVIGGSCTEKGLKEYLVLLSIRETLRRRNASFLQFLLTRRTSLDPVGD